MRYNLPLRRVHGQTELLMAPFYSFREFFHEFLLYHRLIPWCLVIFVSCVCFLHSEGCHDAHLARSCRALGACCFSDAAVTFLLGPRSQRRSAFVVR